MATTHMTQPGAPSRTAGPALPFAARALGYAGLLPFVASACIAWSTPSLHEPALLALCAYAATIASFLGGIHWGIAFASPRRAVGSFAWGVVPQLLGWAALLLPRATGLLLSALVLAGCYVADRGLYAQAGLARWLALRLPLTAGAAPCCLAGALAA